MSQGLETRRPVRPATLRDVAARAEVHTSTASRPLSGNSRRLSAATIDRVKEAASELGYVPDLLATGLRSGRTMTVGIVTADLENPQNAPLIRAVSGALEEEGIVSLVCETVESSERGARILRHLAQRRVDAVVHCAAHLGDAELLGSLGALGAPPIVLAIRDVPGSGLAAAVHDDDGGARLAASHLLDLGHRRIAQLRGPADIDPFVRRACGFAGAISDAGLGLADPAPEAREVTVAEGERLTRALLDAARPSAIFAPSDLLAIGVIRALRERGLDCPGEVSVCGYNDIAIGALMAPALTSIRLPSERLGAAAGELVLELIEGEASRRIELPAELVVRESTAPPGD